MDRNKLVSRVAALLALSLWPAILPAQTQPTQTLVLDLKTAIGIALNENPTIKVADMEIEKKDYSKKETIAGLFPRIDGSASYSRTIEKQTMYMDTEAFDMSAMFAPIYNTIGQLHPEFQVPQLGGGSSSSGETGMKVGTDNTYSVGPQRFAAYHCPAVVEERATLSSADIEQAVESARSSRLSMVNQVEKAYYNLLLAQNSYEGYQDELRQCRAQCPGLQAQVRAGERLRSTTCCGPMCRCATSSPPCCKPRTA